MRIAINSPGFSKEFAVRTFGQVIGKFTRVLRCLVLECIKLITGIDSQELFTLVSIMTRVH